MFGFPTEYELQCRLAAIERTYAVALLNGRARVQSRGAAAGRRRGLRARVANALPLRVSVRVRWEPSRPQSHLSCETAA